MDVEHLLVLNIVSEYHVQVDDFARQLIENELQYNYVNHLHLQVLKKNTRNQFKTLILITIKKNEMQ